MERIMRLGKNGQHIRKIKKKKHWTLKLNTAQETKAKESNPIRDGSLLPTSCRIKKVIELKEDEPSITTSFTEEHQRQDVKQKQPLKGYPVRHRKTDIKTINCKQGVLSNISVQMRKSNDQHDIRRSRIPVTTW